MKTMKDFFLLLLLWAFGFLIAGIGASVLIGLAQSHSLDMGEALRLAQWLQTVFLMILPPLVWVRWCLKEPVGETLYINNVSWRHVGMAVVTMLLLLPAVEWLGVAGYELPWPESIRAWANEQASTQGVMMQEMMNLPGAMGFVRIMLLVSLATALGEELLFRGAFLRLLGTRRIHLVALLIGLVFALVHLEIFGLLSRWLLGSLFVYLVYWTRSLWPAVAAHATNNLAALIECRICPDSMTVTDRSYFPLWIAVVGALLASLVIVAIYRSTKVGVEA